MKKYIILVSFIAGFFLCAKGQQNNESYTRFFYPDGSVSSEGIIRNGKPDGYWKTYFPSGILKSEGNRVSFLLDSIWNFYNQSGNLIQKVDYKYGKKNGYSIKYSYDLNPDGVILSKELYVNDKKEGLSFYYYENGIIKKEVFYRNNKKENISKEFNREGQLIALLDYRNNLLINRQSVNRIDREGKKQGLWKEFYPDGSIKKESYFKNNKLQGVYKEFNEKGFQVLVLNYEEGKIKENEGFNGDSSLIEIKRKFDDLGRLSFQGSYIEDSPIGIHRYFDEEGEVIRSVLYNNEGIKVSEGIIDLKGNRKGKWTGFYKDGEIRAVGRYTNNQKSGLWKFYYVNGNIEQEGKYMNGREDGLWIWYYENGDIKREESYFNGREDGESVEYDEYGNTISKGSFLNGEKEGEWIHNVGDHIEKGIYQTGLKSGMWKFYYDDNSIKFEGEFIQGMRNGRHKFYFPNGEIKEERFFEMGVKERNWKKYDMAGNLFMTVTYKNNREVRINGEKIKLPESKIKTIK